MWWWDCGEPVVLRLFSGGINYKILLILFFPCAARHQMNYAHNMSNIPCVDESTLAVFFFPCAYDGEGAYILLRDNEVRLARIQQRGELLLDQEGVAISGQILGRAYAAVKDGLSL